MKGHIEELLMEHARRWLSAGVAGLAMWLLAGLWHEVVMASFYAEQNHGPHEGTGIILLAYLLLGLFMAYLYPELRTSNSSLLQGFFFGSFIGLLWVLPHELAMAAAHGSSIAYVFKNAAWHMVEQGVGGVVIALMLVIEPRRMRSIS